MSHKHVLAKTMINLLYLGTTLHKFCIDSHDRIGSTNCVAWSISSELHGYIVNRIV